MLKDETARLKKLPAESIMDVPTLRGMPAKTSDARFETEGRGLGRWSEEMLPAPRVRVRWALRRRVSRYRSSQPQPDDASLRKRRRAPAAGRRRFGGRRLHLLAEAGGDGDHLEAIASIGKRR